MIKGIVINYSPKSSCNVAWYDKLSNEFRINRVTLEGRENLSAFYVLKLFENKIVRENDELILYIVSTEFKNELISNYLSITNDINWDTEKWRDLIERYIPYDAIIYIDNNFADTASKHLLRKWSETDIGYRNMLMWLFLHYPVLYQAVFGAPSAPSCYDIISQIKEDVVYSQIAAGDTLFVTVIPPYIDNSLTNETLFRLYWFETDKSLSKIKILGLRSFLTWLIVCINCRIDCYIFHKDLETGICLTRFDAKLAFENTICSYNHLGVIDDRENLEIGIVSKSRFCITNDAWNILEGEPLKEIKLRINGLERYGYNW
jgi:hypothetical protein